MRLLIFTILIMSILSCNSKRVLIDSFESNIYDKTSNNPIKGATIYTDSTAINSFIPIKSNEEGYFQIKGMTSRDRSFYYNARKNISYDLIISQKGYTNDTISLIEYIKNDKKLENIKIDNIYLTPITY